MKSPPTSNGFYRAGSQMVSQLIGEYFHHLDVQCNIMLIHESVPFIHGTDRLYNKVRERILSSEFLQQHFCSNAVSAVRIEQRLETPDERDYNKEEQETRNKQNLSSSFSLHFKREKQFLDLHTKSISTAVHILYCLKL